MSIKIKSATIFRFDGVSRGRIFQRKSPPIVSRIHASNCCLLPVKCLHMPVFFEPPIALFDYLQNVASSHSCAATADSFHEFVKAPVQRHCSPVPSSVFRGPRGS